MARPVGSKNKGNDSEVTEDDVIDTSEVSTEEQNREATLKAAGEAKASKEAMIQAKKDRIKAELEEEARKAEEEKAARKEGTVKKYKIVSNFKCDGVFYKEGNSYNLPEGVGKLALANGCAELV